MNEIWKTIPIADNYEASNLGKIRNKKTKYIVKEQINKTGYNTVSLFTNKNKTFRVHKLVASAFIDNPNNYKEINHIDGNKLNNNVNNLEWCSRSYNVKQAFVLGLKNNSYLNKRVGQYDMEDNLIKKWNSQKEIGIELGYNLSVISNCCNNHIKSAYGYKWILLNNDGDEE